MKVTQSTYLVSDEQRQGEDDEGRDVDDEEVAVFVQQTTKRHVDFHNSSLLSKIHHFKVFLANC